MTSLLNPSRFTLSAPFGVKIYTGDGNDNRDLTGLGLKANLLLVKSRDAAKDWNVVDQDRGATNKLETNNADDEVTAADNIQAFINDGFQVGADAQVNTNTEKYVAYGWEEFGANYGLDVLLYSGTGLTRTVTHRLGATPELILVKGRDVGGTGDWYVFHKSLNAGTTPEQWHLKLNSTASEVQQSDIWNDIAHSATLMSLGTNAGVNQSATNYVAYLFAPIAGVSAFGVYTGTGASNPITGLGFSPSLVVIKSRRGLPSPWSVYDTGRGATIRLQMNVNAAEATVAQGLTSFDADGFTVGTSNEVNSNAVGTERYIWMAWA